MEERRERRGTGTLRTMDEALPGTNSDPYFPQIVIGNLAKVPKKIPSVGPLHQPGEGDDSRRSGERRLRSLVAAPGC